MRVHHFACKRILLLEIGMKLQSIFVASALSVAVSSVMVAGDLSRGF